MFDYRSKPIEKFGLGGNDPQRLPSDAPPMSIHRQSKYNMYIQYEYVVVIL